MNDHIGHEFPRSAYLYNQHIRTVNDVDCEAKYKSHTAGVHGNEKYGAAKIRVQNDPKFT